MIVMTAIQTNSQSAVSRIIDVIGTHGGAHLGTDAHDAAGIGSAVFTVHASFRSLEQAEAFERSGFESASFGIVDVLWEEPDVAPWYGKRGRVRFGKDGPVSAVFEGRIEPVDKDTIRVVPRQRVGGLDLGDSAYPSDGQVRIASIRSIEPA